jgi:uncharacterized protein
MDRHHKEVALRGPAGRLEALLWVPKRPDESRLAAIVCHPHPLYQGTMHNKVVYQTAKTLESLGISVLRFNFRGVGASEGSYDRGRGEEDDVRTALDYLEAEFPGFRLIVAGFSFGAWVGLRRGCADPRVADLIGLGLPIDDRKLGFDYLTTCAKPKLLLQGEEDQYASKAHFESFVQTFHPDAAKATRVIFIPSADHFFTGHLPEMGEALSHWTVSRHHQLQLPAADN